MRLTWRLNRNIPSAARASPSRCARHARNAYPSKLPLNAGEHIHRRLGPVAAAAGRQVARHVGGNPTTQPLNLSMSMAIQPQCNLGPMRGRPAAGLPHNILPQSRAHSPHLCALWAQPLAWASSPDDTYYDHESCASVMCLRHANMGQTHAAVVACDKPSRKAATKTATPDKYVVDPNIPTQTMLQFIQQQQY